MTSYMVSLAVSDKSLSQDSKDSLDDLYRLFPTFLMSDSIFGFALSEFFGVEDVYAWSEPFVFRSYNLGKNLTYLAIEAVGFFVLVLIYEYASLYKTVISKWGNKNDVEGQAAVESIDYDQYASLYKTVIS